MGKYMMRKSTSSSSREGGGVVTRAKTQAAASYLQLRSRRLLLSLNNKLKPTNSSLRSPPNSLHIQNKDAVILEEASVGENTLDLQPTETERQRTSRETTPCSLIRDSDTIKTLGSSTKSTSKSTSPSETKYRELNTTPNPNPATSEVDEFFMGPEKQQQRLFIEKYNFDPVNDKPLDGRYEWVKLDVTKKS